MSNRDRYRTIVSSFAARKFLPWRGLFGILSNCHVQTIVGSEAIRVPFGPMDRPFDATIERFETPDGDFFDVEFSDNVNNQCRGLVVLLHGLESNVRGPLVTRMATAYYRSGFGCCLVSFRGCSGQENNTPGAYHLGFTRDVDLLTKILHERYPYLPMYLSGFSLGGNVVLKFLGELGDQAAVRGIKGGVVCSVPFDPLGGKIDRGFNRIAYAETFLRTLKGKAEKQHVRFPGSFDIDGVRKSNTVGAFDDAYIARIYGYADKDDYYRRCGSKWWLSNIRVPTIAINALDDPFIEETTLPTLDDIGEEAPVRLIYHTDGGHCGFYAHPHSFLHPSVQASKQNTSNLTTSVSATSLEESDSLITVHDSKDILSPLTEEEMDVLRQSIPSHGWLADEMERAISHIHDKVLQSCRC